MEKLMDYFSMFKESDRIVEEIKEGMKSSEPFTVTIDTVYTMEVYPERSALGEEIALLYTEDILGLKSNNLLFLNEKGTLTELSYDFISALTDEKNELSLALSLEDPFGNTEEVSKDELDNSINDNFVHIEEFYPGKDFEDEEENALTYEAFLESDTVEERYKRLFVDFFTEKYVKKVN